MVETSDSSRLGGRFLVIFMYFLVEDWAKEYRHWFCVKLERFCGSVVSFHRLAIFDPFPVHPNKCSRQTITKHSHHHRERGPSRPTSLWPLTFVSFLTCHIITSLVTHNRCIPSSNVIENWHGPEANVVALAKRRGQAF